jgi:beta-N-acetylhexosaminidase
VAVAILLAAGCSGASPPDGADQAARTTAPTSTTTAEPTGDVPTAETRPQLTADERRERRVRRLVQRLSLRDRAGQLFMVRLFGTHIDDADRRNRARHGVDTPRQVIRKVRPGGVILFRDNITGVRQTARFTRQLHRVSRQTTGLPALIGIDQEGGAVDRIGHIGTRFPSARRVASHGDIELTRAVARATARELAALGFDLNFAPVADVDTEPRNPVIGDRALGRTPREVRRHLAAQLDGYERVAAVAPTVKHFPGHGDTVADSHVALPQVDASEAQLRDRELVPFRRAVALDVPVVMTAHVTYPALDRSGRPASLSRPIVTGLLRRDLGHRGVIVTDALDMAGARVAGPAARQGLLALRAGNDVLLMPPKATATRAAIARGVRGGDIDAARVAASARRIVALKIELGLVDGAQRPDLAVVGSPRHERLAARARG